MEQTFIITFLDYGNCDIAVYNFNAKNFIDAHERAFSEYQKDCHNPDEIDEVRICAVNVRGNHE